MGGKMSRTKGHTFERWVANAFKTVFPDARRGLQYRDPRECDVEGTPLRVECKRLKLVHSRDIVGALMQAKGDGERHEDDRLCIAVTKADRRETLVHMTFDTFLSMVERHWYAPTDDPDIIPFPTKEQR